MSANGVALHAMIPVFDDATDGQIALGVLSSLVGLAIVLRGGYRGLDVAMKICIGVMFATVAITAVALWPGTGAHVHIEQRLPAASSSSSTRRPRAL